MKTHRNVVSFLLMIALLAALGAGMAYAKTPDGKTPAEETVCDHLSGSAFGLCNAYCEAMDCELLNDGDDDTWPKASVAACLRVKANFIKVTGEAVLPCDVCDPNAGQQGCPCDDISGPFCADGLICDEGLSICVDDDGGDPN